MQKQTLLNAIALVQQYKQFRQECADDVLNTEEDKRIYTKVVDACDTTIEILQLISKDY